MKISRFENPRPYVIALLALVMMLGAAACSVNPATGKRQLSLIGEGQEIEIGRQSDQQVVASMGLYPDEGLQRYVDELGQRLAAASERPDLPWTFRVIDDPTVNAFALPGGFIYVTRGILTHFNSEAELMGVLGHEIGHVTGRHGVERLSKAQLTQIGLGVGMILEPELRNYGDIAQTGLSVLFLKFSRDDEREADELGLRYVLDTRYNPWEMVDVFAMLQRVGERQAEGGRLPGWLSTHPTPENRIELLSQQIRQVPGDFSGATVARERFLRQLDGVVYGQNPREGFFEGNAFYHPELAFALRFPEGWQTQNQRQAVGAISPNQDAVVVLTLSNRPSAEAAAREFFAQTNVRQGQASRASFGGAQGLSSTFAVDRGQQAADIVGLAAFVEQGDNVYQILGYTLEDRASRYGNLLESSVESFSRVTDRRILNVQPKRIEIVELPREMTLAQFQRQYPSNLELEELVILNEAESADQQLPAGFPVKRVVGGR